MRTLIIEKKILKKILEIFNKRYILIMKKKSSKNMIYTNFWRIHRLHWEKNKYLFDLINYKKIISTKGYKWLKLFKEIDDELMNIWRYHGYEITCSNLAVSRKNDTLASASLCRVPIVLRSKFNKIYPDRLIGCISCSSGDNYHGKPIWWNTHILA